MKHLFPILFLFPCFLFGQNIDSLKLALKNAKHDTTRCTILSLLAETASDEEWPVFNEQLKILAEKNIAANSPLKKIYLQHLAGAFNNIGYLADMKGDIPKALENLHKSLKILEDLDYKMEIANLLNNIAGVYKEQNNYPRALEYFNRSLRICEEIDDKKGIAESLCNSGVIYQDQNNIAKALDNYNRSLKIEQEIGFKEGIANCMNNLGTLYNKLKQNEKALENYQGGLKIQEEIGDKFGAAYSLANIANLINHQNKPGEAIAYAYKAMQLAKEMGYPAVIKRSADMLKSIFIKQNKFKEAFGMFDLEIKMKDSINNEETQKTALKKQMQYDYETQARELKNEQDKKDILAKEELKQREKERNYFIIGFGLVIILALFILRGYRQKQKANSIITLQKQEVEESRKEILDSIHYAKRIQKAHMPSNNYIEKNLIRLQNKR